MAHSSLSKTRQLLEEKLALQLKPIEAAKAFLESCLEIGGINAGAVFLCDPLTGQIVAQPYAIGTQSTKITREKLEETIRQQTPKIYRKEKSNSYFVMPLHYEGKNLGCTVLWNLTQKDKQKAVIDLMPEYARYLARSTQQESKPSFDSTRSIIHDIRNMVSGISGYAQLLRRFSAKLKPEDIESYACVVEQECEKIARMAEEYLSSRRGEENVFGLVNCSAAEILEQVHSLMAGELEAHEIRFVIRCESKQRFQIQPDLLQRALVNLIVNARDILPNGGIIELAAEDAENELIFKVSDNGPGFSPEVASKLFQIPFTSGKENGHGLGLWIVKEIVALFNGQVSTEKSHFGGACVVIRLPV